MTFNPVDILFTCLSYGTASAEATDRLAGLTEDEWRELAELAEQQNVAALLYHQLKQQGVTPPDAVLKGLEATYLKTVRRNIFLYRELGQILKKLAELDGPVIALKGVYLAEHAYANIGLRLMGDVDLLVKRTDLDRIDRELLGMGLVPAECNRVISADIYHFSYRWPDKNLKLELHWSIQQDQYISKMDLDALWQRAAAVTLNGAPALALSLEDLLVYLCLHTSKHAAEGWHLSMLCDLGEVIRRNGSVLDWNKVSLYARQWKAVRAIYVILRLAQELLGVAVPSDWLESFRPIDLDSHYFELAKEQFSPRLKGDMEQLSPHLARLQTQKGLGAKLRLIRGRLFPPREAMARRYPAPADSKQIYRYYPVRVARVLARHGLSLWKLIWGNSNTKTRAEQINQANDLKDWLLSG